MTAENELEHLNIEAFQHDLVDWYQNNQRELPWRKTKNPYYIWVSEIMLQQTRVDTVIPYFNYFIEQFPTPEDLALADEEEVLKAWEGLGYYSRVRNLQTAVKEVVESYGGEVPKDRAEFRALKGVGPYTSGAVMSIAFDQPEPAVDGNVMRVFSRLLHIEDDIMQAKTKTKFEKVIAQVIEGAPPSDFNQAIMELGALICTPKSPGCLLCPVQAYCQARELGVQEELPVKKKKKEPTRKRIAVLAVQDKEQRWFVRKRPASGLLAGLWEFPQVELEREEEADKALAKMLNDQHAIQAEVEAYLGEVEHVFSHLIWEMEVYTGRVDEKLSSTEMGKWVTDQEAKELAYPVSHQKILKRLEE
ncbi:A/G-specific adenine glycosylase [Salsuginibacillus kocurii]|uniref:A/G-specific adenine glycosylase n=1 Tax=Salsuginibacillus kocurii TaxID=427078 RepID=UPI000362121E|nr:A/G-specific adenine glycosylase [Salsuginibacillus kocurii]